MKTRTPDVDVVRIFMHMLDFFPTRCQGCFSERFQPQGSTGWSCAEEKSGDGTIHTFVAAGKPAVVELRISPLAWAD